MEVSASSIQHSEDQLLPEGEGSANNGVKANGKANGAANGKTHGATNGASNGTSVRAAKVERDGSVVRLGSADLGGTADDGLEAARRYVEDLDEDVAVVPKGPDAPSRLTAAGETLELVLESRQEAEGYYRRALRTDARSAQAHESLRRLHRAAGNWRTVAQLLEQEIAQTADEPRRAQLTLALEVLARTRPDAVTGPRWTDIIGGQGLPGVYDRLQTLLDASKALSDRDVEQALSLRSRLVTQAEEGKELAPAAGRANDEWAWSEANLRRFLLRDTRRALDLLMGLFDKGRRDAELLEVLCELLTEHREWERLRRVLTLVVEGEEARSSDVEALASLLEIRYRDLHAACSVLEAGVKRFPHDLTLARRLVEILGVLDRGDHGEVLIDALGNLVDVQGAPEEKAELLWQIGRLFEEGTGQTSAAIEVFHEALEAWPQHGPTLRALGRIYTRQNNWYGLADLFEKELAAPDPPPDAWRRHFQVAELYEKELATPDSALRHYLAVLKVRPDFAPAIQAATRLYTEAGDWHTLVVTLMDLADRVKGRRRQLHLLEQAGRLCEMHLSNDLIMRDILERLAGLDPQGPWVIGALGRLYQRTREWEKLIALHLREAGLVEEVEETATLFWRCGRVAEEHLSNARRAEEFYRQALRTVPDFLPALESLCRLLAREGRFDEILEVSQNELDALKEPRSRLRRMEAMAELLEFRLERRSEAIELTETMLEDFPGEARPARRLTALYAEQGKWDLVADLVERQANATEDRRAAAELWCRLGELRERKLADDMGALDAYGRCLQLEPDHAHALRGALRCGQAQEQALERLISEVSREATVVEIKRRARRHLARAAEQATGNPAAALEVRQEAVAQNTEDREARDMLEAAYAWRNNLPGLAGLWAAAGRSFEEGLLGLYGGAAGIAADHILQAFLDRWSAELEEGLGVEGRRGVWHAALGEMSRKGVEELAVPGRLPESVWARLPDAVRRRCALTLLNRPGGPGLCRSALDRGTTVEPASLRLRALLAASDQQSYINATRAEIRGLATPELRVRRLLELAGYEGVDRHACFAEAVAEQTHDSPIQEDLYSRLETAGEDALLRQALEAHLCADGLSKHRRSHLAFLLGRTLERLEAEPAEAFEAYRTSFNSGQDNHDALLRMARLSMDRGDKWEAIRCLDGFLARCEELPLRVEASLELAALYLAEAVHIDENTEYDPYAGPQRTRGGKFGADALELLTRIREEARGTEHEERCLSRLARAHALVGSPHHAVGLFQELLQADFEERQIDDYLALADLYSASLGDLYHAEQLLLVVFESCPHRAEVLDRLLEVTRRNGTLEDACGRIEKAARLAAPELLTPARRRELLQLAAGLYDKELGRHRKAAGIWEEMADGTSDEVEERRLRVRQAHALSHVTGEESRCHRLMLELQRDKPFDLAPYEGLEALYEEHSDYSRLRVVQQVIGVLDPDRSEAMTQSARRKTIPSRALDNELLHRCLLPEGLRDGVLETLRALEPLANKLWGDALPTIEALGGRKWRAGDLDQLREFASLATDTFDLSKVRFHIGDGGPSSPQVFTQGGTSIWFHRGMFEDVGAEVCRYLAGYAAGLAWSGVGSFVHLDGRDLWHLLEAVLIKQTNVGLTDVTDPRSMELVEQIGSPFVRGLRKRVADAATPHLEVLRTAHCEAWPTMLNQLATRSGLVLSGQVSGAMQAILRSREWRGHLHDPDTQERMRKIPEAADLLRFALSDEFLELRHGCGLDSMPRNQGW